LLNFDCCIYYGYYREEGVCTIIIDQLDVTEEQVTESASFLDDLAADSLDTVELVLAFENRFNDEIKSEIPESESEKMRPLGMFSRRLRARFQNNR